MYLHGILIPLQACGPALQLSPMANRPKSGAAAQPAAPAPPQEEQEPQKIRVVVRKRPINKKVSYLAVSQRFQSSAVSKLVELHMLLFTHFRSVLQQERERGEDDIVDVSMERSSVIVNETKLKVDLTKYVEKHQFIFDESLDETVTNEEVYATTVKPLVHTLFKNGRATCFAYGQTGSGKTFTMSPLPIRSAADIVKYLARPENSDINLYVSCFEIYGNKVFDLLNSRKRLNILEDGKKKVGIHYHAC